MLRETPFEHVGVITNWERRARVGEIVGCCLGVVMDGTYHSPVAAVALTRLGTSLPTVGNVEGQSRLAKTLSSGHVVGHNNHEPGLRRGTVPGPSGPAPGCPHSALRVSGVPSVSASLTGERQS